MRNSERRKSQIQKILNVRYGCDAMHDASEHFQKSP